MRDQIATAADNRRRFKFEQLPAEIHRKPRNVRRIEGIVHNRVLV